MVKFPLDRSQWHKYAMLEPSGENVGPIVGEALFETGDSFPPDAGAVQISRSLFFAPCAQANAKSPGPLLVDAFAVCDPAAEATPTTTSATMIETVRPRRMRLMVSPSATSDCVDDEDTGSVREGPEDPNRSPPRR